MSRVHLSPVLVYLCFQVSRNMVRIQVVTLMGDDKVKLNESPESRVVPYEDVNTKQVKISGETFPEVILGICQNCHWCYTSPNQRGIIENCPVCNHKVSLVPMSIDEVCVIEFGKRLGSTVRIERKLRL